ncbi:hypothetical protein RvY_13258 [Ramazzottius varieornatus]|uniref:Aldehyde oxidase/xanthine dehydrogenase second molybdopterin binding domain-containing protein n=1 Tax=Ramazzottius varieornatus TaxID=947166 RepID=A0A1D1VVU1_RAMVA|nr:hypothetical protein RvY_13258 [Ramazzottius varieornatus]
MPKITTVQMLKSLTTLLERQLEVYDKRTNRCHFPDLDERPKPEALVLLEEQEYWLKPAPDRTSCGNGDKLLEETVLKDSRIEQVVYELITSALYKERVAAIEQFNIANRWRKRGIVMEPMRFPVEWTYCIFKCLIAIYHEGGTIAVTHGVIEMGQGINTKANTGQFEEAIVMGLGYYMTEEIRFHPKTGENLTFGTWKYKPPFAPSNFECLC